jgi:hypothetical protein
MLLIENYYVEEKQNLETSDLLSKLVNVVTANGEVKIGKNDVSISAPILKCFGYEDVNIVNVDKVKNVNENLKSWFQ